MIFQKSQTEKIRGWESWVTFFLEFEAARANGFLPGHNYLGTSCDITSIAQKLWHTPCTTNGSLLHFGIRKATRHLIHISPPSQSLFLIKPKRPKLCPTHRWWEHGKGRVLLQRQHENTNFVKKAEVSLDSGRAMKTPEKRGIMHSTYSKYYSL